MVNSERTRRGNPEEYRPRKAGTKWLQGCKLPAIIVVVFLAACAGLGAHFSRLEDDFLVLGQTTSEQVMDLLPPTFKRGRLLADNEQIDSLMYIYAGGPEKSDRAKVTPSKSLSFYFLDDRLVGYQFMSDYKEDSTDYDASKVSMIKKGQSTLDEVVFLLGAPGGRRIYPMAPPDTQIVTYWYMSDVGRIVKMLVITLDPQETVTDVQYSESVQFRE